MHHGLLAIVLLARAATALAQSPPPLTLADAIARARSGNPDARVAASTEQEAAARAIQARAGWFPRVDVVEGWQRGDQPVFVFGSLLAQRQFTEANFAIEALNHPDPVNNFRSAVMVEQPVFDGGATLAHVRGARIGQELATLARQQVQRDLAATTTEAFGAVLQLEATRRAAEAAVSAAQDDLRRARDRRDAGVVTEADVLALDVHLASMREQALSARAEELVARARLNQVMGVPLDSTFALVVPEIDGQPADAGDLEAVALRDRAEVKQAALAEDAARTSHEAARATFLPQVGFQGGWEWNGGSFGTRASSWVVGTQVRLNVFHGLADRARLAETGQAVARQAIERERAETAVRLDVRASRARLDAARARVDVGRASVAQARESQRVIRDRYENGLADVTELLRAAQALVQAESQETAARVDALIQSASLNRALGR